MKRESINVVGLFLILGAAIGFVLGLVVADAGWAATYGAVGAGLGVVAGAIVATLRQGRTRQQ